MKLLITLLIIISLQSCKEVVRDTRIAEQIIHDVADAEEKISKDTEEPTGCEQGQIEKLCDCPMCQK